VKRGIEARGSGCGTLHASQALEVSAEVVEDFQAVGMPVFRLERRFEERRLGRAVSFPATIGVVPGRLLMTIDDALAALSRLGGTLEIRPREAGDVFAAEWTLTLNGRCRKMLVPRIDSLSASERLALLVCELTASADASALDGRA
jgi:hypothetical protein